MDSTTKKVLIGGGVVAGIGGLALLFSGTAKASTPGKSPAQLGDEDGCARGTSDALAGKTPAKAAEEFKEGTATYTAWRQAAKASGNETEYLNAYVVAHQRCFNENTKTLPAPPLPKPKTTPPVETPPLKTLPEFYVVKAGDTPVSIASSLGMPVDLLMAANPDIEVHGYPFNPGAFTSTAEYGNPYPPKGTRYTPTWQAMHGTLYPVFQSSVPGSGGGRYWAFNKPGDGVPFAMSNSGFGRIYSDGGLKLVGPWYIGLKLRTSPLASTSSMTGSGASGASGTVGG